MMQGIRRFDADLGFLSFQVPWSHALHTLSYHPLSLTFLSLHCELLRIVSCISSLVGVTSIPLPLIFPLCCVAPSLSSPPPPPLSSYQVHEEEMKELVYLRDMYTDLQRYLFLRNLQVRAALRSARHGMHDPPPPCCLPRVMHPSSAIIPAITQYRQHPD